MKSYPSTTLLISTYNWPKALTLVFKSILAQSVFPNEIIVADDGSKEQTRTLIQSFQAQSPIPVKHVWHEDIGFRKTIIMNKAIRESDCEYIVQIDGDIILDKDFIKDHLEEAQKGFYIKGSRAMLTAQKSSQLIKTQNTNLAFFEKGIKNKINAIRFPLLAHFFYKKKFKSNNLRGCNCAFWKKDFIAVNGYNNALTGWGHEDIELAARFVNLGLRQKQLKLKAVCYHIYHQLNSRKEEDVNMGVYENVVSYKIFRCQNGYNEIAH